MLSLVRCRFMPGFHEPDVTPLSVNFRPFMNASGDRFAPLRSRPSSRHGAAPRETISASAGLTLAARNRRWAAQQRLELPGVMIGGTGSLRRTPDTCYPTAGAMSPAHRVVHDPGARADPGRP